MLLRRIKTQEAIPAIFAGIADLLTKIAYTSTSMTKHTLTELKLHQKSKELELFFEEGEHFLLTCAFLRLSTPSAEAKNTVLTPADINQDINIIAIEPVGNYGVKLIFNDGHNTGIYSWKTLYELGKKANNPHHE